jgi:ABC-2 type transport system permease protein
VIFGFAVIAILFGLNLERGNLALVGLCVVVISFTTAGLGLLFGSIGLILRDAIVIANVVYYLMLIFCGVNFPISRLPGALQIISYGLPLTRGVEAARQAAAGATISQVGGLLAGEIVVGVVYAMLGYALFRALEAYARRGGLQEAY